MKSPKTKALVETHCLAIEGLLRDPNCVIHYFRNLRKFLIDNSGLFSTEDISIRKCGNSRAYWGLSSLYNGKRGSWKGWTLVSDVEVSEGQLDLLRRKYVEHPVIIGA
jgi:hypothetical protein